MLDEYGRSDFDALQDRARRRRWYTGARQVAYLIFDPLVDRGADITGRPVIMRKAVLDQLLKVPLPHLLKVGYIERLQAGRSVGRLGEGETEGRGAGRALPARASALRNLDRP